MFGNILSYSYICDSLSSKFFQINIDCCREGHTDICTYLLCTSFYLIINSQTNLCHNRILLFPSALYSNEFYLCSIRIVFALLKCADGWINACIHPNIDENAKILKIVLDKPIGGGGGIMEEKFTKRMLFGKVNE